MKKKTYHQPSMKVVHINNADIICDSLYGPNSEIIPVGDEEGDEEIAPPPSAKGIWNYW